MYLKVINNKQLFIFNNLMIINRQGGEYIKLKKVEISKKRKKLLVSWAQ